MKKQLAVLFLTAALLLPTTAMASADNAAITTEHEHDHSRITTRDVLPLPLPSAFSSTVGHSEDLITPLGEAPCAKYGTHQMVSQGFVNVRDEDGKVVHELNGGGWYKCGCGDRFLAWGHPHFGKPFVYYATEGAIISQSGLSGVAAFVVNRDYIYFSEESTLPGYIFS